MLKFDAQPNLPLEALSYLGRRAAGNTWEDMEQRLRQRRAAISPAFLHMLTLLKEVTARLDAVTIDEDTLALFRNLEGFPHNTVGTGSPAFLLFYGLLEQWDGDSSGFFRAAAARTAGEAAWHMALAMDLGEEYTSASLDTGEFMDLVLSAPLPDSTRIAVLDTYRRRKEITAQLTAPLEAVLKILHQEQKHLDTLAQMLSRKINAEGCEAYLTRTSRLRPAPDTSYQLRPFLFGMDTSLTSDEVCGVVQVYCGIGRDELLEMLAVRAPVEDDVFKAFKLLGDRTRFDILRYLRSRSAYGQELCNHFGLSRNTIHHHMNKLVDCGLVRCATDGNRIYYSLDQNAVALLLDQQRTLFAEES